MKQCLDCQFDFTPGCVICRHTGGSFSYIGLETPHINFEPLSEWKFGRRRPWAELKAIHDDALRPGSYDLHKDRVILRYIVRTLKSGKLVFPHKRQTR